MTQGPGIDTRRSYGRNHGDSSSEPSDVQCVVFMMEDQGANYWLDRRHIHGQRLQGQRSTSGRNESPHRRTDTFVLVL